MKRAHVFGPVLSRRLGRSLGVDLVRYKTCSLDCVYCQLGRTLCKTVQRGRFVDPDEVRGELKNAAERAVNADFVTLSGSGEPTLSADLGTVIEEIRRVEIAPAAVLTNATLLGDAEVRKELAEAELVVPSLDVGTEEEFRRVNRPHPSLEFEAVVEGLREFCEEFAGRVWLEVMLVSGMNDSEESLREISKILRGLRIEKVQLNTVTRPPTEGDARGLSGEEMRRAAEIVSAASEKVVEPVRERELPEGRPAEEDAKRAMVEMMARRPSTLNELAKAAGRSVEETKALLDGLSEVHRLEMEEVGGRRFFSVKPGD